jgi:RNA polymerase sigma-70 factor (ECF subfamily)
MPERSEIGFVRATVGAPLTRRVLSESDDATLALALAAGNPAAPHVALERFGPMVHRIVKRTLRHFDDSEDLAQEVFVSLFQKASTLRDPTALRSYIVSTTTFKIRRELRNRVTRRRVMLMIAPAVGAARTVNPDPEAREALRSVHRILENLSSRDRSLFILRFVEGRMLTDVAERLGLSLATLKRRLSRLWRRILVTAAHDPPLAEFLSRLAFDHRAREEYDVA